MATQMWSKFQKYWSEFYLTLAIACVLDPRFKLGLVEFSYKKLYGDDCIECMLLRNKLWSIFEEYNTKTNAPTSQKINVVESSTKEKDIDDVDAIFKVILLLLFTCIFNIFMLYDYF